MAGRRPRMHTPAVASRLLPVLVLLVLLAPVIAACGGSTPTPPRGTVATAKDAIDAVRAVTPLFDGVDPRQDDAVGQAAWWTAIRDGASWAVTVSAGWGDCESGCIDRHEWTWLVAADGSLELTGDTGSPLTDEVLAALHAASDAQGAGGRVVAGPVCPVEQPGDPSCAPRPVAGATLVVEDAAGGEVARFTTDPTGLFRIALEPGAYTLVPSAVEGYMGGASPVPFEMVAGTETWVPVLYDTGIR
jgi:hypothetical protein